MLKRVRVVGLGYGHHRPTVRVGPLLPATWEQAQSWLRSKPKLKLGWLHALVRQDGGQIVVREVGSVLPVAAYVPPITWGEDGTAAPQVR